MLRSLNAFLVKWIVGVLSSVLLQFEWNWCRQHRTKVRNSKCFSFSWFHDQGAGKWFTWREFEPAQTHISFDRKLISVSQLTALPFKAAVLVLLNPLSPGNWQLIPNGVNYTVNYTVRVNYTVLRSLLSDMYIPRMSEILTNNPTWGGLSLGRCAGFEGVCLYPNSKVFLYKNPVIFQDTG